MDLSIVFKGSHMFAVWLAVMLLQALNELDTHYERFPKKILHGRAIMKAPFDPSH